MAIYVQLHQGLLLTGFISLRSCVARALVNGAKKALSEEIQKDPILRAVPSLQTDLFRAVGIYSLCEVYRECVRILGGGDYESHLLYAMMRGMTDSLSDPHTKFFSPEEAQKFLGFLRGDAIGGGIGVFLGAHKSGCTVIEEVIEDTPAFRGGLLARDLIIEVDGISTKDMPLKNVSKLLRGVVESSVRLTIVRKGAESFDVTLVRKPIHVGSVTSSIMNGVGYIKLRYFGDDTNAGLDACFAKFDAANVRGYVLDMRGNGGGYVNVAVHTVSKFLPGGSIVASFVGRAFPRKTFVTDGACVHDSPVVVLINKGSASASEIVAGALQDNGCKIVGVKSYGKGSMQEMHLLSDGSMLKVTRAHWFTPNLHPVDGVGITPNIIVEHDENSDEDVQLERALQEVGR
ncbi:MAG: S41 family peptidase [Parcubacteria group bacterium]|nr:S41 family peptidase [Parcubacteria group bacterium]